MRGLITLIYLAGVVCVSAKAGGDPKLTGAVIGAAADVERPAGKLPPARPIEAAFDGRLDNWFASKEKSYAWVGLDLGEPHIITRIGWAPADDWHKGKCVELGVFEGANSPDFMDALPLYVISTTGVIGSVSYADVACSRSFRYVRYVGPADSNCHIAELEFFGHAAEGDDTQLCQLTNLPTVSIHTKNGELPYDKEHQIAAQLAVVSVHGLLSEPGKIRERGNYSRNFPKRPYRIKFDKKQHVMDAPAKAKKWTLINNYGDKTLMRNLIAFEVSRRLGMPYTPYGRAVDVIVNGEYKGCYQLCDQVEARKGRVEIEEMTPHDNEGVALTGGYLIEIDANSELEKEKFTSLRGKPVSIKSPDEDSITSRQREYIRQQFNLMEGDWRQYLDTDTFLRYFLVGELTGNIDAFWCVFMYKHRGDPLFYTGPAWDFDLAFDNDQRIYPACKKTDFICFDGGSCVADMREFVKGVMSDEEVWAQFREIWAEARESGLTKENLVAYVDSLETELSVSQQLNFKRWPIMNKPVHQNPKVWGNFAAEVENVRRFIGERLDWMDSHLGYAFNPDTMITAYIDFTQPYDVFTLQGRACGHSLEGLPHGLYIVRQGRVTKKIAVSR